MDPINIDLGKAYQPSAVGQPIININIHTGSESSNPGASLKSYADEVDRIASQDRVRTGVDEFTEAQIKLHLEKLKALLNRASNSERITKFTRDASADSQRCTLEEELRKKTEERDAIIDGDSTNKYVTQSRFTNKGILGTMANPNDGSGTGMIAGKELMTRLLSKSMKLNSGDAEILKLRSQNPLQYYPGVEDD